VLNAQLNEAPAPPSQINPALPAELNNIVLRAMVKAPDGRFQTAEEFRAALRNLQEPRAEATSSRVVAAAVAKPAIAPAASAPVKSQRSLWLGLGAVTAIIAMVAAATLLPRMLSTHAGQKTPAPVTGTATPAQSSGSGSGATQTQQAQASPAASAPNPLTSATPETTTQQMSQPSQPALSIGHAPGDHPRPLPGVSKAAPAADAANAPPPGPSKQEIAQAHERMIQLGAKADAAKAGIQQVRSQQQAQGLDMRGDILAAMNRMTAYLNEADHALSQNDLQAASDNMDRAEKELSTLETFLGR
jgi:serine/threonine-protein kinase